MTTVTCGDQLNFAQAEQEPLNNKAACMLAKVIRTLHRIAQKCQAKHSPTNRNCASEEKHLEKAAGEAVPQAELARWARQKFKLSFTPSQPVISRILSTKAPLLTDSAIKRKRSGAQPQIEKALAEWIRSQYDAKQCVNGDIIKQTGKKIVEAANALLSTSEEINIKFSNGWLARFQKRWNLRSRRVYGEAGDTDKLNIDELRSKIKDDIKNYCAADIWNADETGLFYCMPPDRTILEAPMPGRKKNKERLTLLVCSNADGSEKMPLMIIGNSRRPRCFQNRTGQDLDFDYWSNQKAWMNRALFFEWLLRFNVYIARTPGRQAILMLDNASAHGTDESVPSLSNVTVCFLPPNTTARLQPMDAGIIAALKRGYRKMQYELALDNLQDGCNNIYNIDQLLAMKYVKAVWNALSKDVIQNCWKATGLVGERLAVLPMTESLAHLNLQEQELSCVLESLVTAPARMSVQELLCAEDDDLFESVDVTDVAGAIARNFVVNDDDGVQAEEEEEDAQSLPPFEEQKSSIAVVYRVVESQHHPNFEVNF